MRHNILVYRDEGACPFCVSSLVFALQQEDVESTCRIGFANARLLQTKRWQRETRLLIFPGGRDIPYHRALQGIPNRHIVDFVTEQGGSFLGIGAGAYYGSALVEFEKGGPLEVVGARELQFFRGIARGPAYGLGMFDYQSPRGERIAATSLGRAYYNGGCAFIGAEDAPGVSVTARYTDLKDEPPAALKCTPGAGIAVLSGVHPECSAYHPGASLRFSPKNFSALKEIERERRALFRTLLQELGLSLP